MRREPVRPHGRSGWVLAMVALQVAACGTSLVRSPAAVPPADRNIGILGWGQYDMAFADSQHGWMIADDPGLMVASSGGPTGTRVVVYRTSDGGQSWTIVLDRRVGFRAHFAFSSVSGAVIAFTGGKDLLSTSDGGASWTQGHIPDVSSGIPALDAQPIPPTFISPVQGWAIRIRAHPGARSDQVLYQTSDGGVGWTEMSALPTSLPAGGPLVAFPDPSLGVLDTASPSIPPSISMTHDGGRTWTSATLPAVGSAGPALHPLDGAGDVVEATVVPAATTTSWTRSQVAGVLYLETHGGDGTDAQSMHLWQLDVSTSTWMARNLPVVARGTDLAVRVVDATHLVAFTSPALDLQDNPPPSTRPTPFHPQVFWSNDSGRTWKPGLLAIPSDMASPIADGLGAIDFANRQAGWAVTGTLEPGSPPVTYFLRTVDGGATWKALNPPPAS